MAKQKAAETKKKEKAKEASRSKTQSSKKQVQKKKGRGLTNYLKEVRQELKKVSWPGRKEVYQSTLLVLAVVAFFVVFVGLVDQILIQVIKLLTATITGG